MRRFRSARNYRGDAGSLGEIMRRPQTPSATDRDLEVQVPESILMMNIVWDGEDA
jgi:hypothetical protein